MKITRTKKGLYTKRVYIGKDAAGKDIVKRITAPTKTELTWLELQMKRTVPGTAMTLKTAMQTYNDSRSNILSPSTMISYLRYADRVFSDALYNKDIDRISDADVQAEANRLAKKVSPKTVRNYVFYLITVIEEYAKNRKVKVVLPQKKRTSLRIPTEKEMQLIYDSVKGTPLELPVLLASMCGMRRSEIAALMYDDIDLDNKTVTISKAVVRDPHKDYIVKVPKSYAGYRTLDLPAPVMTVIRERKEKDLPLIELHADVISSRFRRLMDKIGLHGVRFHNLRHYYATVLLELGIPDKFAIELTGHSTPYMLREVYQHTREQKMNEYRELVRAKLDTKLDTI